MSQVFIFDFDDTLFRSPRPPAKGHRSDWWRQPESLQSPHVQEDMAWAYTIYPTYDRMIEASRIPDAKIIVLTGRPPYMTSQVAEILQWIEAPCDLVLAVGSPIVDNKLEVIWKLFDSSFPVSTIEIWDDKADHLLAFRKAIKHWSPETEVLTRLVE